MVPPTVTPLMFQTFVALAVPSHARPRALQLYPPGTTSVQAMESYIQFTSDGSFTAPSRRFARALALGQSEPVWRYLFDHHFPGPLAGYGAFHGSEIFYVFNSFERTSFGVVILENDRKMLSGMRSQWAQFARTGDPSVAGQPTWVRYDAGTDPYQRLSPTTTAATGLRTPQCDFMDSLRTLTGVKATVATLPPETRLMQNYPNPFNPATTVQFQIGGRTVVSVRVYDLLGRQVESLAEGAMEPGVYEVPFDAGHLASGLYIMRLTAGATVDVRKMLLLR